MSNRLSCSTSAYLRSAEHQPIDWYEFGEEAFQRAKELDRPVLLDIGAVWCHWCHVIDRESYEDPEIAKIINDHYVAVKVDRDQRPDIDARYQQVVSSLCGQGGWPLTAFLTYDGRVISGGTYFPPSTLKTLLLKVKVMYDEKKSEIFASDKVLNDDHARELAAHTHVHASEPAAISKTFYEEILQSIRSRFDDLHGGVGTQPKFPHFSALQLVIAHLFQNEDPFFRKVLTHTLDEMARGGVYDQIAGGFHRYSVDRVWHVPHFEKMAYDNAEALQVYSQAYRLTGNPLYREVAEGIIRWVRRDLSDLVNGGFYASQDADIDLNDDGDHFTWSLEEAQAVLSDAEYQVIIRYYDMTADGDMHDRPGRNVLWIKGDVSRMAQALSLTTEQVEALLTSAQRKMLVKRAERAIPFIDKTLYTNWNGMFIASFLEAAELLGDAETKAYALKSLDYILNRFYRPGDVLFHSDGVPGFLEDYAFLALACVKAHHATADAKYLTAAREMLDILLADFEDANGGGFYDTRHDVNAHGLLRFRRKPVEDNPSSSANATVCQVLALLAQTHEGERYGEKLEQTLQHLIPEFGNYGLYISALGLAAYQFLHPPLKLEVVGDSPELVEKSRQFFYPGKAITYSLLGDGERPEVRPCFGQRCLAPLHEGDDFSGIFPVSAAFLG